MLSGSKGFHVWVMPEVRVPAVYVAAARRGLAEVLGIEADPQTLDVARTFRIRGWSTSSLGGGRSWSYTTTGRS